MESRIHSGEVAQVGNPCDGPWGMDVADHNGVRIVFQRGRGDGSAEAVEYHFHAQYSEQHTLSDKILYSFRIEVSPDYLYESSFSGPREASAAAIREFAESHGLGHMKAMIDLGWPPGRDYTELRLAGGRRADWQESHMSDRELRAHLLGAFKRAGEAAERFGGWKHIGVAGISCVLSVPEDRIEGELIGMRKRGLVRPVRALPADLEGPPFTYGDITRDGLAFLDQWEGSGNVQTVAALFCDVAGSTQANRAVGNEKWAIVMSAHHARSADIVRRHGGRVPGTQGDGLLATFSTCAPAVNAGLDLAGSGSASELQVRVGINLGDFAEVAGERVEQQDVLNVASRIQGVAEPGEVWVSEAVKQATSPVDPSVNFEALGVKPLRGVVDPPPLHRALRGEEAESA